MAQDLNTQVRETVKKKGLSHTIIYLRGKLEDIPLGFLTQICHYNKQTISSQCNTN